MLPFCLFLFFFFPEAEETKQSICNNPNISRRAKALLRVWCRSSTSPSARTPTRRPRLSLNSVQGDSRIPFEVLVSFTLIFARVVALGFTRTRQCIASPARAIWTAARGSRSFSQSAQTVFERESSESRSNDSQTGTEIQKAMNRNANR